MRIILILIGLVSLSACATKSDQRLAAHADDLNGYDRFGVCFGYACKQYKKTGLSEQEWGQVRDIFSIEVSSAAEERVMIAKAIAQIEQFVGPKTGTDHDKARAPVINFNTGTEMDCIDESTNSTTYLFLMRQDGLIKHHTLGGKLRRNWTDLSYPHSTATIYEIGKDKIVEGEGHYVVDSWFHQNGALAEVIPARVWRGPWYPKLYRERYIFSAS